MWVCVREREFFRLQFSYISDTINYHENIPSNLNKFITELNQWTNTNTNTRCSYFPMPCNFFFHFFLFGSQPLNFFPFWEFFFGNVAMMHAHNFWYNNIILGYDTRYTGKMYLITTQNVFLILIYFLLLHWKKRL